MPSPSDDTIDSREIIEEINDLEVEISGLQDDIEDAQNEIDELSEQQDDIDIDADGASLSYNALTNEIEEHEGIISSAEVQISDLESELKPLTDLQDEAEPYAADWRHGVTLIADDYFEDYAYELAVEIGAISPDAGWPVTCIDWRKAVTELQMDYTSVEFDGCTYWVR